jgi:hypothetical protein
MVIDLRPAASASPLRIAMPHRIEQRGRNSVLTGSVLRSGHVSRARAGTAAALNVSAVRASELVSAVQAEPSGVEPALGSEIANVIVAQTPRASLTAISSAVSRQLGHRGAAGEASSLPMMRLASWLRPTPDNSTARLFRNS